MVEKTATQRRSFRRTLLTGLFILLPLFVTGWVIYFAFAWVDNLLTPFIVSIIQWTPLAWILQERWLAYLTPIVSLMLLLIIMYVVGLTGGNVLGRQILKGIDKGLQTIPVVRGIYNSTRQFIDTFSSSKRAFQRVVLVEYPRHGVWTLGFVTADTSGEIPQRLQKKVVSVFLPTTPNPTSGWLAFVPAEEIVETNLAVDDAFKLIITGGVLDTGGEQVVVTPLSDASTL